jgi:glutamine synthetase
MLKSFGAKIFGPRQIEQSVPKAVASNWIAALEGHEQIERAHLDICAKALKEWAVGHGATHYSHWFQPLTGSGAEKHDAFLSWNSNLQLIESFRGKDLLQGEPDASSFPSGGLRATHLARGYTIWDPSSPPFLWESAEGYTLCIPSLFFSWRGEALDYKIPLLRSDQKIDTAGRRLLKLVGMKVEPIFSTLGPEQEYFTIDRRLYHERPDLLFAGRTVFGACPPKGQELEDHYFSAIPERVLSYMIEFEQAAFGLGIPVKTRHNEVAPAQHEVAPLFERSSLAADHNVLLMELMRQKAVSHGLACLFHEKPFAHCNGSGKHCNWSLSTSSGLNLLDPAEDSVLFLILLTAVICAVHEHAALLRCSIASAGNDWRLGGSEAPPTILSIYLGAQIEALVEHIIQDRKKPQEVRTAIDLRLKHVLPHIPDASDRNRTSFFAFTGNKFEFRAVGASQHVAWPITILNTIVADALHLILDEIEAIHRSKRQDLFTLVLPVIRKHLQRAEPVLFSGDSYSRQWEEEAQRRGLPNIRKSVHAFSVLTEPKTERVFKDILSQHELHARQEIFIEKYAKQINIEINVMVELFRTAIFPAAVHYQKWTAECSARHLQSFAPTVQKASELIDRLEEIQKQALELGWNARAKVFCELALPVMEEIRHAVDHIEQMMPMDLWPLPKYREMLFLR